MYFRVIRQRSSTSETPVGAFGTNQPDGEVFEASHSESASDSPVDFVLKSDKSTDLTKPKEQPDIKPSEPSCNKPVTKPATDLKLNDISISLGEVVPHPSLPLVRLLEGEGGVTAVLHPTSNRPKPGVAVFVLQITNTSANQVTSPPYIVPSNKNR